MRSKRTVLLLAVVLAPCVTTLAPTSAGATPDRHGPFAVGAQIETFVDTTRPIPANGDVPESPSRTIDVLIVYPARGEPNRVDLQGAPTPADLVAAVGDPDPVKGAGRFPLVVYAHGFGGGYVLPFFQPLAEAGYVVVAPRFPLTRFDAPGGPQRLDYVDQPGDVSFVISEMLDLPRRHRDLQRIIDPKAVGVTGSSLGASTVLGVGFNSCCQDRRIKAAVSIAGVARLPYGNGREFPGERVPLLVIHGTADASAPYDASVQLFADAPTRKFFVTLDGAPHIRPGVGFGPPWEEVAVNAQIDFFDRYLKSDDAALRRLQRHGNVEGVATFERELR